MTSPAAKKCSIQQSLLTITSSAYNTQLCFPKPVSPPTCHRAAQTEKERSSGLTAWRLVWNLFVLTKFWSQLRSNTEYTLGSMESICQIFTFSFVWSKNEHAHPAILTNDRNHPYLGVEAEQLDFSHSLFLSSFFPIFFLILNIDYLLLLDIGFFSLEFGALLSFLLSQCSS